jgi:hypothetical protein
MIVKEEILPLKISNLIQRQFPDWYVEHGDNFVAFVQAYYEWMEASGNPLYYSRNYYNIKDIDNTFDEFIVYFKEKYLKDIQLSTESDVELLVKHALDIYRSKGTERSVKLLFQLVFNRDVKFYYPSLDLFKLSDGVWLKPKYLELSLSERNTQLTYKEVVGLSSGAIGFVDSVVRRWTKNRLQDVAYISAIFGQFQYGEKLQPTDKSLDVTDCPVILGSLTNIDIGVAGTGKNYKAGDMVTLSSTYGDYGTGLVMETIDAFGVVDSVLVEGGYGYQGGDQDVLYVSNTMFTVSNLKFTNTASDIRYFNNFDKVSQAQAFLNYTDASAGFGRNEHIFTYYSNGASMGEGIILEINASNSISGTLLAGLISGNLNKNFYTTSNAVSANLLSSNGYYQANATGLFLANDNYIVLNVDNIDGDFILGEKIWQTSGHGSIIVIDAPNSLLTINAIHGVLTDQDDITGQMSGTTADITSISVGIGLVNTTGTFYNFPNNHINSNNITGTLSKLELGAGYSITVSNSLLYSEQININSDLLADYASKGINATAYGFPGAPTANLTSGTIGGSLSSSTMTIGKIASITVARPGQNYSKPPFVRLDNPFVRAMELNDFSLVVSGPTSTFTIGDTVTQNSTDARGIITSYRDNKLTVQNLRYNSNNWFVPTTNTATRITTSSGTVANVENVSSENNLDIMGLNLSVDSKFTIGNGAIRVLKVVDSGFGFLPDENVYIDGTGEATARVQTQGTSSGYYRQKGGFLSDDKKLFDGWFWQNYSYQIVSAMVLRKYEKMLKQLSHPIGTIMFGRFVHVRELDSNLKVDCNIIRIT